MLGRPRRAGGGRRAGKGMVLSETVVGCPMEYPTLLRCPLDAHHWMDQVHYVLQLYDCSLQCDSPR